MLLFQTDGVNLLFGDKEHDNSNPSKLHTKLNIYTLKHMIAKLLSKVPKSTQNVSDTFGNLYAWMYAYVQVTLAVCGVLG